MPRFVHNVSDLLRRVLFLARPTERSWVCFLRSPAAQALDQIRRHGVLPRVMAAEPPNRAIDQILQFVVGIRIFHE
jgi:hypothetical protein